jgi:LuxR family maltose regulon positive regulatory protein
MGAATPSAPGRSTRLVAAKVQLPPVPARVVDRPRLTHHEGWSVGDITVVAAGPGHGKTLATRQWVAHEQARRVPVTWLSVDQYDDHPTSFWPHLVGALQGQLPGVGRSTLALVARPSADDLAPAEALVGELDRLTRPAVLVLDDAHHLRDRTLVDQLALLCERRPRRLRIVMTTRAEPPLPFPTWRRDGRLGELRAADLRFTTDEGIAYLRNFADLSLDDGARGQLVDKLDGWPAMVALTALALRDRPDAMNFVRDRLASDRLVMDYLVGDVVDRLTPEDRQFLFALSVLDRFDAALAVELTGDPLAGERLLRLDRDGLFVAALDPDRTTFRFHRLIAELLHHELRWRGDDSLVDAHRQAATVLDRGGYPEEAMIHFLQAGDPIAALGQRTVPNGAERTLAMPALAGAARAHGSLTEALSERETVLLDLLPTHLNYREMAAELYVSVNTVKTQIKSVYRKLGATSRTEAVREARERGLLR